MKVLWKLSQGLPLCRVFACKSSTSLYRGFATEPQDLTFNPAFQQTKNITNHIKKPQESDPKSNIQEIVKELHLKHSEFPDTGDDLLETKEHHLVFSKLNDLEVPDLKFLIEVYSKKNFQNYQNFLNSVQKPIIESISMRLEQNKFSEVSDFLGFFSNHSNPFGLYCSPKLEELVNQFLIDRTYLSDYSSSIPICYNFLYFAYICNFLSIDCLKKVSEYISRNLHRLTAEDLVGFGVIFSQFNFNNSRFWLTFSVKRENIENLVSSNLMFDIVLLFSFLKKTEPRLQTKIYKQLSLDFREQVLRFLPEKGLWKKERVCQEREICKEILDQKKILNEIDLNEGFWIDLAIPFKRIAFEFCGPESRVWPSGRLNGRSLLKKEFFTCRKWQIETIDPLENLPYNQKREKLVEIIENILKQSNN